MKITALGDSALTIRIVDENAANQIDSLNAVLMALRNLETAAIPGVIDLAPAYTTIGVFYDSAQIERPNPDCSPFDALQRNIHDLLSGPGLANDGKIEPPSVEIPVCYDREFGPDLSEVARASGLDEAEVVSRHASAAYRVACVGFVPGFPFLTGLPPELATPRRTTPRKTVPAGSVGIGGGQTGIYPGISPGGWNLIGRTPLRLFDVKREPPVLLRAGDQVRIRTISREDFNSLLVQ